MISSFEFVSLFSGISGIVVLPSEENHLTRSVLGDVLKELEIVYGDEELLVVSMDEAQSGLASIDKQPVVNDLTLEALVIPNMEFRDSALPLIWFLLKIRPNRDKKIMKNTLKVERYIKQKQIGLTYYEGCKRIVQEWGNKIQQYWSLNNQTITSDIIPSYRNAPENVQNDAGKIGGTKEDTLGKAVRDAIVAAMGRKDSAGKYVFHLQSQWEGTYYVLKMKKIYTGFPQGFQDYLRGLGLEGLRLALPNKNVARHNIYGKVSSLDAWTPKGATEIRIHEVATIFNEELEKRLPKI